MRAVVVDRWVEPAELALREAPEPALRPGTLLVDVKAAGCNFFDVLMCRGTYQVKPPFPFVPGAEVAGVVAAVGEGVTGFAAGDRVFGSSGLVSFAEGAALPIVYPTSYAGLVHRAALQPGETLLVHAAAGGVGVAAVQIGKALGARVLATAGGAERLAGAKRAGADVAMGYQREDFVARVREETGGRG